METIEFGTKQAIEGKTPSWSNWIFRIIFLFNIALTGWVAGTSTIEETSKLEILLVIKIVDGFAWGLTRMFGVVVNKDEIYLPEN